ncbi:hypothetical protein HBI56_022530 [Parastagonospora nodorum]|uniref:RING-type domain-containing protein n=2 Tax=Phaeosphaeria nodorum (strain SN15 / ATCC MYA-4574 / FGSC 10173) TaxID=321614 RepID=A0A7U2F563_PHANO|nr:hypothetical protein SNOG_06277 [Parastagonospora nodorum SN15]KAH3918883.1 hypothetical protein HBH56_025980 [Parastagonospora nodorum]EAT86108.2 hypothetical protein SNOG_06277 [Parastagonospora nodorum SN15]KAH3934611.1 hypothetical protein HBH54_056030 [Parastagonospora nodorum]KAH3949621.1 hypothetical protein HBH53_083720 [Parastagonospora nodorum]KAH3976086.1 hypothetical protein HBH51_081630 [Parastagonospora nodorum]
MSGYEVEHNISDKDDKAQPSARRPDLSTFFSQLELVDTSDPQAHTNANAVPQPENMSAAFRLLANAFELMRGRPADEEGSGENDLLANMIEVLRQNADDPPTELKGVPDTFLDELERVPKKSLKPTDTCPICVNPFLEDQYPLVVQLPCHKDHYFDLDCIRPWLKLNSTCPLDRKELLKKQQPPPPVEDDDDGEYDDMYA